MRRLSVSQLWDIFTAADTHIEAICELIGFHAAESPQSERLQPAVDIVAREAAPAEFALRQKASDEIVRRWLSMLVKTGTN